MSLSNALTIEGTAESDRTTKRGRPSSYDPEMCQRVKELGSLGNSKAQIARDLGISFQTWKNWEKAYPDFLEAVKEAQELALAWWEDTGKTGMYMGAKDFNATMYIFQMKNRFREHYNDASKNQVEGDESTEPTLVEMEVARRVLFLLDEAARRMATKKSDERIG